VKCHSTDLNHRAGFCTAGVPPALQVHENFLPGWKDLIRREVHRQKFFLKRIAFSFRSSGISS
jgi:hypothetical protein